MVDNRSAGFYGIGGAFNFKSGDISGTTAKMQDDKMGQGNEYYAQRKDEDDSEKEEKMPFTDRSAQLRATLSSLAMMNVADVIKNRTFQTKLDIEKSHQEKKEEKEKSEKKRKGFAAKTLFITSVSDEDSL